MVEEIILDEKKLNKLADHLISPVGVPIRNATLVDQGNKDVLFFKGDRLVTLMKAAKDWPKGLPEVVTEADIVELGNELLEKGYMFRCEKVEKGKVRTATRGIRSFDKDGYYIWLYEGSQFWTYFWITVICILFVAFSCYSIWPPMLKKVVFYVTLTITIFLFGLVFLRLLVYSIVWMFTGYHVWIFPNIFDESLSITDSFFPVIEVMEGNRKEMWSRVALAAVVAGVVAYYVNQPTEFDELVQANRKFMEDLYEGNLLSDMGQNVKDHMGDDLGEEKAKKPASLEDFESWDIEEDEEAIDDFLDKMIEEEKEEAE